MKNEDLNLPILSELDFENLKVGDKLYQVSFESEYDKEKDSSTIFFKEITYIFNGWIHTHLEAENQNEFLASVYDERYPKVNMKLDLRDGFFKSHKEAAAAIVDCMSEMARLAKETFDKQYGD